MKPETPNDERKLDAQLTRAFRHRADYIDDNGFSDRVMQSLPAPSRRPVGPLLWVLLVAALAGVLGVAVIPVQAWAYTLAASILAMPLGTMLQVGALITLVLTVALGGWVLQED